MYDDTCRFLAENFSADFASWLLGEPAEETLRQVAQRVDQIADPTTKANLMAASGILAGLKLEDEIVYRILRRDIMQESTVYRSIERDARKEEKRAIPTERFAIALNLLRGGVALNLIVSSTGLSIEEVQQIQQQLNESAKN
jgi:predicted transposase YdaD